MEDPLKSYNDVLKITGGESVAKEYDDSSHLDYFTVPDDGDEYAVCNLCGSKKHWSDDFGMAGHLIGNHNIDTGYKDSDESYANEDYDLLRLRIRDEIRKMEKEDKKKKHEGGEASGDDFEKYIDITYPKCNLCGHYMYDDVDTDTMTDSEQENLAFDHLEKVHGITFTNESHTSESYPPNPWGSNPEHYWNNPAIDEHFDLYRMETGDYLAKPNKSKSWNELTDQEQANVATLYHWISSDPEYDIDGQESYSREEGTSDGAKKGWLTRKGSGMGSIPDDLKQKIQQDAMANQDIYGMYNFDPDMHMDGDLLNELRSAGVSDDDIIDYTQTISTDPTKEGEFTKSNKESYAIELRTLKEEKQRWETARSQAEKGDYQPFINLVKQGGGDWYYYETEPKKEEILEQIDMELDNFNSGFYGSLESYAGEDVNTELLSTDEGIRKWLSQFGASPQFIEYVIRFPNAQSVRMWKAHWEMGLKDWGGSFGNALFNGDMYDAVTFADKYNSANLKLMGYESHAGELDHYEPKQQISQSQWDDDLDDMRKQFGGANDEVEEEDGLDDDRVKIDIGGDDVEIEDFDDEEEIEDWEEVEDIANGESNPNHGEDGKFTSGDTETNKWVDDELMMKALDNGMSKDVLYSFPNMTYEEKMNEIKKYVNESYGDLLNKLRSAGISDDDFWIEDDERSVYDQMPVGDAISEDGIVYWKDDPLKLYYTEYFK